MTAHLFVKDIQPSDSSVPVGATAIASIAEEITYRGYPLSELAEHCTFEEVAQLLLRGELPGLREKNRFEHRLNASRHLPEGLCDLLASLPAWTPPIESLRTSVSVLAHFDQDAPDQSIEAKLRKAERMLGQIPTAIAWRARALAGLQPVEPREGLGHAAQFLHQLRGKEPQPHEARALEMALIVFAEHEFNPSTYTARVVASTGSDLHSSVVAAICALKGQRHGGFDEEVVRLLVSLEEKESAGATITRADLPTGLWPPPLPAGRSPGGAAGTAHPPGPAAGRALPHGGTVHPCLRTHGGRAWPESQYRMGGWQAVSCVGTGCGTVSPGVGDGPPRGLERPPSGATRRPQGDSPASHLPGVTAAPGPSFGRKKRYLSGVFIFCGL